jgi:hypothetical protein
MAKSPFERFSNPHVLVTVSFLLAYILVFIPVQMVVYQPLPSNDDVPSNSVAQDSNKQTAYLGIDAEINGIIGYQCILVQVEWSSNIAEITFWIFKNLGISLVLLPVILWFGVYLRAYPVPLPLYLLIVVGFLVGPVVIMLIFFHKSDTTYCNPIPTFLIHNVLPFWPAMLIWFGSMVTSILAIKEIRTRVTNKAP